MRQHEKVDQQVKNEETIVDYLYRIADSYADKSAVFMGDKAITYRELNERSNQLARYLRTQGIGEDSVVAILFPRSIEMLIAIFGIVKAGGAYLPLAPDAPSSRINNILASSNAQYVIYHQHDNKIWSVPMCHIDDMAILNMASSNLDYRPLPKQLAYVIYTSGSTGAPKGVANEHGALLNRIVWMQKAYPINDQDVLFQKTVYTFDVSVWEMFWWAMYGACVVLLPSGLESDPRTMLRLIQRHQISVIHFVPSMLNLFVEYLEIKNDPALSASLKWVFVSGEKLSAYSVTNFYRQVTDGTLVNLYGPTEAAIDVSYHTCLRNQNYHDVPIGRAIDQCRLYVLDEALKVVADGEEGELYIAGIGLARGYLNNPKLTERSFFIHPALCHNGQPERVYKTGDLVRYDRQSGEFYYIGRNDFQIKIRGLRVELGEIEAHIMRHPNIQQVAVIADQENVDHQLIYAFIVSVEMVDLNDLRLSLSTSLPNYMLPNRLIVLSALPLSANGKCDRKQLIAIARQQSALCVDLRESTYMQYCPLSPIQESMWFMQQLVPDVALYNNPAALQLEGKLNLVRLNEAIKSLMLRHSLLRATVELQDGKPILAIPASLSQPLYKTSRLSVTANLTNQINLKVSQPMPLRAKSPLCCFELIILNDMHHVLVIHLHHIISDGWSKGVLLRELQAVYNGEALSDEQPMEYIDYIKEQEQWRQSHQYQEDLAYWRETLNGNLPVLDIVGDRQRQYANRHQGAFVAFELPVALSEAVIASARAQRVSLYNYLLAVFIVFLQRNARQQDYIVGMPVAGRLTEQSEHLIAPLINVLPLRLTVDEEISFSALVQVVRRQLFSAFKHQRLGFEEIVRTLNIERSAGQFPVYQCMFQIDNMPIARPTLNGLTVTPLLLNTGASQVDISLSMQYIDGRMTGTFEYNTELYSAERINNFITQFFDLLEATSRQPSTTVNELIKFNRREYSWLQQLNDTKMALPPVTNLLQLLTPHYQQAADQIALRHGNDALSYAQLQQAIARMERWLIRQGVKSGDYVVIMLPLSCDLIIIQLAVIAIGAAYVPIDNDAPLERNQLIFSQINARLLITTTDLAEQQLSAVRSIALPNWQALPSVNDADLATSLVANVLNQDAVIIFTSGTTGVPKGVRLSQLNLVNLICSFIQSYQVSRQDVLLPITSIASASFVGEILPILAAGGSLVLAEKTQSLDANAFVALLKTQHVTIVSTTPSLSASLSSLSQDLGALRLFICGGEAMNYDQIAPLLPHMQVVNGYGLTESGICSTYHIIEPRTDRQQEPLSIGRPIQNTQVYVVDVNHKLVPPGAVGELCFSGLGLSPGYLNEQQNSHRFIQLPELPDVRVLKTGDRARWALDGNLFYLGREDRQVQIRGHRVELGEIESQLKLHPDIADACVDVRRNALATPILVAFYVSKNGVVLDSQQIRIWLSIRLPLHMLPLFYIPLPTLPIGINGKVDPRQLPEVDLGQLEGQGEYVAPTNKLERQLVMIWQQLLGVEQVSCTTNFFDLGGHSLLLVQMQQMISEICRQQVSLVDLMRFTTIKRLASYLKTPSNIQEELKDCALQQQRADNQRSAFGSTHWGRKC
ncbi:non-ribosomal peptide synthetase [Gilliamella sp. App2-1]|uniref:colibactin non-ribosomal peptide synthetase ClbH n=1 Tax=Gilliamella sp. App2-1 TaxID=3120230 RepID=UPI00082803D4|nr:colibactin non-ribosomal peptide synthetase ClbH [Gilliamella apicola]OCG20187.1 non-ribosomal peptide synthetase [Gilliamella apicola]